MNNLKQIGLALHGYHDVSGKLPPTSVFSPQNLISGCLGAHVRLLPYLDQGRLFDDFNDGSNISTHPGLSIQLPVYRCPSYAAGNAYRGSSYACNQGEWFVWDPSTGRYGSGPFNPNCDLNLASISDGTSSTIAFSEVLPWTPMKYGLGTPSGSNVPRPERQSDLDAFTGDPSRTHVNWATGTVDDTGFTTCLSPNGSTYDFVSSRENQPPTAMGMTTTIMTYASVASRSQHSGLVNTLLLDGSVRSVSENISVDVWRALGSRAGKERIGEF